MNYQTDGNLNGLNNTDETQDFRIKTCKCQFVFWVGVRDDRSYNFCAYNVKCLDCRYKLYCCRNLAAVGSSPASITPLDMGGWLVYTVGHGCPLIK